MATVLPLLLPEAPAAAEVEAMTVTIAAALIEVAEVVTTAAAAEVLPVLPVLLQAVAAVLPLLRVRAMTVPLEVLDKRWIAPLRRYKKGGYLSNDNSLSAFSISYTKQKPRLNQNPIKNEKDNDHPGGTLFKPRP